MPTQPFTTPFSRRSLLRGVGLAAGAIAGTSLTAACSGDATGPTGQDLSTVAPVERGELDTSVIYKDGYVGPRASSRAAFGDGQTEFRIVVPVDQTTVIDWNDNQMTTWFEQRTGVKVVFDQVIITAPDGGTDMTKINAMIASGDLPDAFLGIPFSRAQVSLFGAQGLFVDLTPMIEKFAPEVRAMWSDYPVARTQALAADGKVYAITGINDCYHCATSAGRAWVNTEYIEQVGGAMPGTTEELSELLSLFKAKDPSPGKNIIPLGSGSPASSDLLNWIMNAFVYNNGATFQDGRAFTALDGERVMFQADRGEWREGLRYLRRLFDASLITSEAFTMNDQAMLQAGNQGRLGVARMYYWGTFADIEAAPDALWRSYEAIPPLTGPGGVAYAAADHYSPYGLTGLQITSSCASPQTLVQWADAQMELEATLRAYGGDQGNWQWAKQGDIGIDGAQGLWSLDTWPAPASTSWAQFSVMYRSNDFRLGQIDDPSAPDVAAELYRTALGQASKIQPIEMQVPPLLLSEEQLGRAAEIIPAVRNHVRTSAAEFTIGAKDINDDAAWNSYVDALRAMQLPTLLEVLQESYDNRPR